MEIKELKDVYNFIDRSDYEPSEWEFDFLSSVERRLSSHIELPPKQEERLLAIRDQIIAKGLGSREGMAGKLYG